MSPPFFFMPQPLAAGPPNSFTIHASVRPPITHRPWPPHLPPPFSPPDDGGSYAAPAYNAVAPPPAYSELPASERDKLLSDPEIQHDPPYADDDEENEDDGLSTAVVVALIALNVVVWGMVAWGVVQDGRAGQLWAELQQSDRISLDI